MAQAQHLRVAPSGPQHRVTSAPDAAGDGTDFDSAGRPRGTPGPLDPLHPVSGRADFELLVEYEPDDDAIRRAVTILVGVGERDENGAA